MVCRVNREKKSLSMLVIEARGRKDGFFLALVPNDLSTDQVKEGFAEIGIEPREVFEVDGWEKAEVGLAAAFLPFPKSR